MKRIFKPFMDAVYNQLEQAKFYRAPRAPSTKLRRYEQVDLTKEFEIRAQRRELEKKRRLEELYESHDAKAANLRDITPVTGGQSDLSEGEGMTTDGEDGLSKRQMVAQVQQEAQRELLEELKAERDDLVAEFDGDTDLKSKMLVQGVQKVSVLGIIKYH